MTYSAIVLLLLPPTLIVTTHAVFRRAAQLAIKPRVILLRRGRKVIE